jgi:hypothetical protein
VDEGIEMNRWRVSYHDEYGDHVSWFDDERKAQQLFGAMKNTRRVKRLAMKERFWV